MEHISSRAKALRWTVAALCLAASASASAEIAGDAVYIHCRDSGGDFKISELNHSVSYFSDRYQEYRPVCRDCEVTAWGSNITMKDGDRTVVQIDRVSGRVWVRGSDAKEVPGAFAVRSFQGTCMRGTPVVPSKRNSETARAF